MTQILTYRDAERYLLSTINERVSRSQPYRLERMVGFLAELGDPQRRYPTIHVGGTSGKGSTCTLLANVLQAAGHRTGLHVKPHLQSMTERACIDGVDISEDDFAATLASMMPAIERAAARGERPSYYETLLALAFRHFADRSVDIAVIEVGLGGRLDGTNVLAPLVTAITSIGYDHTEVLGDTLELIAAEKAGIAKPGVPMVANIDDDAARHVVMQTCAKIGAPFIDVRAERASPYVHELHLDGAFQRENAKTALAILSVLSAALTPDGQAIARGFATTRIAGRMERFATQPMTILDIAHNEQKARALAAAVREIGAPKIRVVLSIAESKDAAEIVAALCDVADEFFCTAFHSQPGRAPLSPELLAGFVRARGGNADVIEDPLQAFAMARQRSGIDDLILVTGSTLLVATLRSVVRESEHANSC